MVDAMGKFWTMMLAMWLVACGAPSEGDETGPVWVASGGAGGTVEPEPETGGAVSAGGQVETGGAPWVGGGVETGGAEATGGTVSAGGTVSVGGTVATGGSGGVAVEPEPMWERVVERTSAPHDADNYTTGIRVVLTDDTQPGCSYTFEGEESEVSAPQVPRMGWDVLCLTYVPAVTIERVLAPGPYTSSTSGVLGDAKTKTGNPSRVVVTVEALTLAPLSYRVRVAYY